MSNEQVTVVRQQQLPPGFAPGAVQTYNPGPVNFRCPFCQSSAGPFHTSRISNAGWVMAIVLFFLLCLPLFWIGFLIRENYTVCRACGMKLS